MYPNKLQSVQVYFKMILHKTKFEFGVLYKSRKMGKKNFFINGGV